MGKLSKKMLIVFIVATLVGSVMHFVYSMFPNPVTALFSPTNESLWEHMKILFWPYLVSALVLTKGGEKGSRAPWMLSLLLISAGMLLFGFIYHIIMGGERLGIDVAIYVLMMSAGFVLPGVLHGVGVKSGLRDILVVGAVVLGLAIILFTFLPPDHVLFADLSRVNTWATIPYC